MRPCHGREPSEGQKDSSAGAERLSGMWREVWVRAKFLDSVNTSREATACQVLSHDALFQSRWHKSHFTKAQRHGCHRFFFKPLLPPRVSFSPRATKPSLPFLRRMAQFSLQVECYRFLCEYVLSIFSTRLTSLSQMVLLIPRCVPSVQPRADI